jgi:hypothetical protein
MRIPPTVNCIADRNTAQCIVKALGVMASISLFAVKGTASNRNDIWSVTADS